MLAEKVKALIDELGSLELAAAALSVRPSTLRKVLLGRSLSGPALAKLRRSLDVPPDANDVTATKARLHEHAQRHQARLRSIYDLYRRLGTLEAVGRNVGLTRERVRQLLVSGTKLGFFKYQPREYPYIAKDKLLADYRVSLSLDKVAELNNVPTAYISKLLTAYRVRRNELRAIGKEGRKDRCIEEYRAITSQLSHHPTTTELQSTPKGHSLNARIVRLWGSTDAFRETLNIPAP